MRLYSHPTVARTVLIVLLLLAAAAIAVCGEPEVRWVDSVTGRVLFTSEDIVRFDWDRQVFELKRQRAMDLLTLDFGQCRSFEVKDKAGVIYRGMLFSSFSSQEYDGPTIRMDGVYGETKPPLYAVDGGYPLGGGKHDADRFAPRLHTALLKARKLGRTESHATPEPIKIVVFHEWAGLASGLKMWTTAFPETFRLGTRGRIHLTFFSGAGFVPDFDVLRVSLAVVAADGSRSSPQRLLSVSPDGFVSKTYGRRTYVTWLDLERRGLRSLRPGPVTLELLVSLDKKTSNGFFAVHRPEVSATQVTLLPK
jgi:hypothetical protein